MNELTRYIDHDLLQMGRIMPEELCISSDLEEIAALAKQQGEPVDSYQEHYATRLKEWYLIDVNEYV